MAEKIEEVFKWHKYQDHFIPVHQHRWDAVTDHLDDDTYWAVRLEKWTEQRTLLQNNAFHGPVLAKIIEATGYEHWEAKEEMLRLFAPRKTWVDVEGNVQEKIKRTKEFTIDEFKDFLDQIIRWAAQFLEIVIDIDPSLRTSGHQPRVPDEDQINPQWTKDRKNE